MNQRNIPIPSDADVNKIRESYRSLASRSGSFPPRLTPEQEFLLRHEIAPHVGHDGTTIMAYQPDMPENVLVPVYI